MELNSPADLAPYLRAHLDRELVEPATEFLGRASKHIRKQLVLAGFLWQYPDHDFSAEDERRLEDLGDALELIHSASLIIDDIQDSSPTRRGGASVHMTIGNAKAINLGNWLYFKGFEKVDELGASEAITLNLLRFFRLALLKGHAGQALDLGMPIRQTGRAGAPEICDASIRLKTGALTGLAFSSGAILAGARAPDTEIGFRLGEEIGCVLQSLDDLKNLKFDPLTPNKRFEDLKNERPGLIWSVAACHESPRCWSSLLDAIDHLPNEKLMENWLEDYSVLTVARRGIDLRLDELRTQFSNFRPIETIFEKMVKAYDDL